MDFNIFSLVDQLHNKLKFKNVFFVFKNSNKSKIRNKNKFSTQLLDFLNSCTQYNKGLSQ